MTSGASPRFTFVAGNLALDFLNTATIEPEGNRRESEGFQTLDDLDAWCVAAGLSPLSNGDDARDAVSKAPGADIVLTVREQREALRSVLTAVLSGTAPDSVSLAKVNDAIIDARSCEGLRWTGDRLIRTIDPSTRRPFRCFAPVLQAAETLLTGQGLERVKQCESSTCEWFFIDTSKNGSRRWCRMEVCGNREKGRRRLRREKSGTGP